MIFLTSHSRRAPEETDSRRSDTTNAGTSSDWVTCGFTKPDKLHPTQTNNSPFRYYFRDAPEVPHTDSTVSKLDALADAMVEDPPAPDGIGKIPPVFTYWGQFIDHDVTANTDRENEISKIDAADVPPVAREDVERELQNLRFGSLGLDSLYGGGPIQGPWAKKLQQALRFPKDRSMLWIGTTFDDGLEGVPLPRDPGRDVLRLDRLLKGNGSPISADDILALPEDLRALYVNKDGSFRVQRAILGDARNDENLAVSQLHLAFARVHNRIAATAADFGGPSGNPDQVFEWSKKRLIWIHQWLILHEYLPQICDPEIVSNVLDAGAPLYSAMFRTHAPSSHEAMPIPLEFSVAAFRFGHSMARAGYDWSRRFGREVPGEPQLLSRASFRNLFEFTGNASPPMSTAGRPSTPRLPQHWAIEWDRFVEPPVEGMEDRSARPIDTLLSLPMSDLFNEEEGSHGVLRNLAKRNLRRGHRLNLPSAQSCIAEINDRLGYGITPLSPEQLSSSATGAALEAGDFLNQTPLWFYVLKEAEAVGVDGRLGPLGSCLIAETLAGLVINDPESFWRQPGSGQDDRWHPSDGPMPAGEPVSSIKALLRTALVL